MGALVSVPNLALNGMNPPSNHPPTVHNPGQHPVTHPVPVEHKKPVNPSTQNEIPAAAQFQIVKLDKKLKQQEQEIEEYKSKFQKLSQEYTELLSVLDEKCKIISSFEERMDNYQKNYHKAEYKMAEMKDKILQAQETMSDYRQKVVELEGMTRQITNKSSFVKSVGITVLQGFIVVLLKIVVLIGYVLKLFQSVSRNQVLKSKKNWKTKSSPFFCF